MILPCKIVQADVVDFRDLGERFGLLSVVEDDRVVGGYRVHHAIGKTKQSLEEKMVKSYFHSRETAENSRNTIHLRKV